MKSHSHVRNWSFLCRRALIGRVMLLAGLVCWSATASMAAPAITAIVNAASYQPAVAPGTWAVIFGHDLAGGSSAQASSVPLPYTLNSVSVAVGGIPAPLLFVSPGQINALIPFEAVQGVQVPLTVTTAPGVSATRNITLERNAPAIFTQNSAGTGAALAFDSKYQPITSVNGDLMMLYATGLGPTDPAPASSAAGGANAEPLNRIKDQLQVLIGEVPATVLFAGLAPGLPGVYQVNVVPARNLESSRLVLVQNGMFSNSVSLPIPAGTNAKNVKNVTGTIQGLYPASGLCAALGMFGPQGQVTSGPIAISQMLVAAELSVSFDLAPGAKPFKIVATSPAGNAVIDVDPIHKTYSGVLPSLTGSERSFDFSRSGRIVYDLKTGKPFPGSIVPLSRVDPMAYKAGQQLPYPNSDSPVGFQISGSIPDNGHVSIGGDISTACGSGLAFGQFLDIGLPPPSTKIVQFDLLVDGVLTASVAIPYQVD